MSNKARETVEQIAARYGAKVAGNVVIQKIPTGQSATFSLPVWDGNKLVGQEAGTFFNARSKYNSKRQTDRAKTIADESIIERVRELSAQEMSQRGIGKALGIPEKTVGAIQRQNNIDHAVFRGQSEEARERRAKIKAVYTPDKTTKEIADETGFTVKYIQGALRSMGYGLRERLHDPDAVAKRPANVKRLREQGLSHRKIADRIGCSLNTVGRDLERLFMA